MYVYFDAIETSWSYQARKSSLQAFVDCFHHFYASSVSYNMDNQR